MGYSIYISKKRSLKGGVQRAITLEAWTTLVDSRSDLTRREDEWLDQTRADGQLERTHPWAWRSGSEARLWLLDGEVECTGADAGVVKNLWVLAQALDAEVVGDDGERYASDGSPETASDSPLQWWERAWVTYLSYLLIATVIALVLKRCAAV